MLAFWKKPVTELDEKFDDTEDESFDEEDITFEIN